MHLLTMGISGFIMAGWPLQQMRLHQTECLVIPDFQSRLRTTCSSNRGRALFCCRTCSKMFADGCCVCPQQQVGCEVRLGARRWACRVSIIFGSCSPFPQFSSIFLHGVRSNSRWRPTPNSHSLLRHVELFIYLLMSFFVGLLFVGVFVCLLRFFEPLLCGVGKGG